MVMMIFKLCFQTTFSTFDLKEDKDTEYIIAWKSKGLFKSRLEPLCKAFSPNIFSCRKNNYINKIANVL